MSSVEVNPSVNHPSRPPTAKPNRFLHYFRRQSQTVGMITDVDIFFGSLTGTSERYASLLAEKATQRGASVTLQSLEYFNPQCFDDANGPYHSSSRLTVFVVSTHFAGGSSPNAEAFSQWLKLASGGPDVSIVDLARTTQRTLSCNEGVISRAAKFAIRRKSLIATSVITANHGSIKEQIEESLSNNTRSLMRGVQYAVFGVGNSMYLTYNAMAKFVDARLQALRAVRLCPLGLGDVTTDIDGDFGLWETRLLQHVASQNLDSTTTTKSDVLAPLRRFPINPGSKRDKISTTQTEDYEEKHAMMPQQRSHLDDAKKLSPLAARTTMTPLQDHYGRSVRLRIRCRPKCEAKRALTRMPSLATAEADNVTVSLSNGASQIRYPCFELHSMNMLKRTASSGRSLNPSAYKEVVLIRISIQDTALTFQTGDTLGYYPPNDTEIVEAVGSRLGFDVDAMVDLSFSDQTSTPAMTATKDQHLPFPSPCSIRTILRDFLELKTISREFVRVASGFVTDPCEYECLQELIAIDSSASFNREFAEVKSALLKLLEMAPSMRIPLEVLVNITPLLRPRLYSIASSHFKNDRAFDIVVALGDPNEAHGLSISNFRRILAKTTTDSNNENAAPQETDTGSVPAFAMLRGFVAPSRFKTPENLSVPMIMIANGIGIAPLRALLQHRELEYETSKRSSSHDNANPTAGPCKNLLIFGCSNQASLIFEAELRDWESKGFVELHIAYSCEPGVVKQHVQDLVATQLQQISSVMAAHSEARVYVCGKRNMAQAMHHLFAEPSIVNDWYPKALVSGRYIENIA